MCPRGVPVPAEEGLTREQIEDLKPKAKRYEVVDGGAPGLVLRVTPGGAKVWTFRHRVHGRPARYTIGSWPEWTPQMARAKARKLRVQVDEGEDPGLIKSRARDIKTVAELMDSHA